MKQTIIILLTSAFLVSLLNACGPSKEEQRQLEQARQDSLEQVRQQKMAQQRQDSIAQARQDSMDMANKSEQPQRSESRNQVSFTNSGAYTVQVESWRSKERAQNQVKKWKNRGFDNAFVVENGNKAIGDVWFRVRLGRVNSKDTAEKLQDNLQEEFSAKSWIANAK